MSRRPCRSLWRAVLLGLLLLVMARPVGAQEPTQAEDTPESGVTVHVVQRGETLFRIAQNYGTTVEVIQAANNIPDPTLIAVGQRLIIPAAAAFPVALAGVTAQPSDSLSSLALRWGVPEAQLAGLNRIVNPDLLFVGQALSLPVGSPGAQPIPTGQFYVAQPGDTATRIAARQGMALAALLRANHLLSPAQLYPGQRLLLAGSGPPLTALADPWTAITLHPLPAEQGHTLALRVETGLPGSLTGRYLSRDLRFISPDGQTHTALVGIHAFTRPGVYPLTLTFTDGQGRTSDFSRGVLVADGGYTAETIDVPPGLEALLDEVLLDEEYARVSELMSGFTPERYWEGLFLLPTGGDVASAYGTRRNYHSAGAGLSGRFHSGADFAVPIATPIRAPAPGIVVFAGPLEVRGNATIINHGWGVYSGYWHQAGILVQAGDVVQAGQEIGSVGNTGLVTGAHLHWELWVSGVQVDPLQWVRESMP